MQNVLLEMVYRVSSRLGYLTSGSKGEKTLNEFPKGRLSVLVMTIDPALNN